LEPFIAQVRVSVGVKQLFGENNVNNGLDKIISALISAELVSIVMMPYEPTT
jgi:hypothetical protein